jgi:hypothetical protein
MVFKLNPLFFGILSRVPLDYCDPIFLGVNILSSKIEGLILSVFKTGLTMERLKIFYYIVSHDDVTCIWKKDCILNVFFDPKTSDLNPKLH